MQYNTDGLKEGYNKLLNILAIIGVILLTGAVFLLVQCMLEVRSSYRSSKIPNSNPDILFEKSKIESPGINKKSLTLKSPDQKAGSKYQEYDESRDPISRRSFEMDGVQSLDF